MSDNLDVNELIEAKRYEEVKQIAEYLNKSGNRHYAAECYKLISIACPEDISSKFMYAQLVKDGTHLSTRIARDQVLEILKDTPQLFDMVGNKDAAHIVRFAARQCHYVGPLDKSIYLFKKLINISDEADDYFELSEVVAKEGIVSEAIEYLEKAVIRDPLKYKNEENESTLSLNNKPQKYNKRNKINRYPSQSDFRGNLKELVKNHIANELLIAEKFIKKDTQFFSMGSCFARTVAQNLCDQGYQCQHLEITEHINTTFANRIFVEWLRNESNDDLVVKRFKELLPPDWTRESVVKSIKNCDVFILTLGVAPAFFDKNGKYILPRASAINTMVLAEEYEYRNTSVAENLENAKYLLDCIRLFSPECTVIVTVSPIPLMASFNNKSCVISDCLSKSTMRVVADELVYKSSYKKIYYWPSFEVFRWAGSNSSTFFGEDDDSSAHVSSSKVKDVIESFLEIFSED